jgi:hypothetical protein
MRRLHQPGAEWGQLADSCKKGRTCKSCNFLTSWELLALEGQCCIIVHETYRPDCRNTRQKTINCSEKYMQKFSFRLMITQYFVGKVPLILVMFAVH